MTDGSVLVDISIDQGGVLNLSKPTNHDDPTFIEMECYIIVTTASTFLDSNHIK